MGELGELFQGGGFDTDSVEPASENDFDPIPVGWYPAEVKTVKIESTKAGNGKMLTLMLNILGDRYANRKVFVRIMLVHPNKDAQDIGRRKLSALGKAVGIAKMTDENMLIGKTVDARVVIEPAKGGYPASNNVQTYAKIGHHSAKAQEQPQAPQASTASAPAADASKPVWER